MKIVQDQIVHLILVLMEEKDQMLEKDSVHVCQLNQVNLVDLEENQMMETNLLNVIWIHHMIIVHLVIFVLMDNQYKAVIVVFQ